MYADAFPEAPAKWRAAEALGICDPIVGEVAVVDVELRRRSTDRRGISELLDLPVPHLLPARGGHVDEVGRSVAIGVPGRHGVVAAAGVVEHEVLGYRGIAQVSLPSRRMSRISSRVALLSLSYSRAMRIME
jgi:hypothetical protein